MNRITRHQMWMEVAETAAKRSTCSRANNGAVIVRGRKIHGLGYNGPPSGDHHCTGLACVPPDQIGCVRSIHAERNAMDRAGDATLQADLYCTTSPCVTCCNTIIERRVSRVFYRHPYRNIDGLTLLTMAGIKFYRLTQNGDVIASSGEPMPQGFE